MTSLFATIEELAYFENAVLTAADPGYVLIGAKEKVYRRDPDTGPDAVRAVGQVEADTVTHLLANRYLIASASGRYPVEIDGATARGREVRPRSRVRDLVARWARDRARHARTGRPCPVCEGRGWHLTAENCEWSATRGVHRPPSSRTPCPHCQTPPVLAHITSSRRAR